MRRLLIAVVIVTHLLPFSDDISADSRLLMRGATFANG